jgi:hypothetical protein
MKLEDESLKKHLIFQESEFGGGEHCSVDNEIPGRESCFEILQNSWNN